jgi:dihydrofolate reductase
VAATPITEGDRASRPRQRIPQRPAVADHPTAALIALPGGGTTFHFVTEGFDAAYSAACRAAGDNGVDIAGGASTVRQALIAGVIDEFTLDIAPVLLGSGERIFDGVESFGFEPAEVLHSPPTTHIRYRRVS